MANNNRYNKRMKHIIPVDGTLSSNIDIPELPLWIWMCVSSSFAHDIECKAVAKTIMNTMEKSIFVAMPATRLLPKSFQLPVFSYSYCYRCPFIHSSHRSLSTLNCVGIYFFIHFFFSCVFIRLTLSSFDSLCARTL